MTEDSSIQNYAIDLCRAPAAWSIASAAHHKMGEVWAARNLHELLWIDTRGPIDVMTALVEAGILPEPTVGLNDLDCRWVEECDWLVRCTFPVPELYCGTDSVLVLDQVDCWADVWLNGHLLGQCTNQFRTFEFAAGTHLNPMRNELVVHIRSPKLISAALERTHGKLPSGFDTGRVYARRCQCSTGWDWAARLNTCGVYGAPRIEQRPAVRLRHPNVVVQSLQPEAVHGGCAKEARISLSVALAAGEFSQGRLSVLVRDAQGTTVGAAETTLEVPRGTATHEFHMTLANPRVWWPVGYGEQPLYTADFTWTPAWPDALHRAVGCETRFGVRTVSLGQKPDAHGTAFLFHVNGLPVFCRGANWIPADMLPGRVTPARVRKLILAAASANMNCLRVWGGGVYESDYFYDLCDEYGLLVWQDFMFACAAYPMHAEFVAEVEAEAEEQICRLRNHPSIILWCGNNENEWLHQLGELRQGTEPRIHGERLWSHHLAKVAKRWDPSRPYHQSSPFGSNGQDYNDMRSGDRHNWECWAWWRSPDAYLTDFSRFVSEFGFQGFPLLRDIGLFAPGALSATDPALQHHQKMILGHERLARYAAEIFPLAAQFEDWVDLTQRLQGEILRRAVEHWRRLKFHCGGTLIWQLNDAWSAISWSLIDYYGMAKPALAQARRFFAPVLVTLHLTEDGREVMAFPANALAGLEQHESKPSAGPAGDAARDQVLTLRLRREVHLTVLNDLPAPISGNLTLLVRDGSLGVRRRLSESVVVPPLGKSAPITYNLASLGIQDIRSESLHAVLDLSADSAALVQALENPLCRAVAADMDTQQSSWSAPPSMVDFDAGLSADLTLVELRYFKWPAGLRLFGEHRPQWYDASLAAGAETLVTIE